ncbi:MAG: hypothetical protein U9Q77_04085 [Candidatus Marinimicrobia bacterium]|nr:hypothetical protein [Candidatus Neomarinimicrobiota bacterium]
MKRNDKGQITSAKHLSQNNDVLEKSHYTYSRKGQLKRHHLTEYFQPGPPRISRDWIYDKGQLVRREEKWFTRDRSLEKKLTIYYDNEQKPYLEETWGLGNRIESSTEYYYDYKHRLDKSRRNFFYPDGGLRDYWLTIYNDQILIINEEHYLPDNSLIAFYRYAYHPVHGYREREELLDSDRNIFISRKFDEYGLLLEEEEMSRDLKLLKRKVFEYNDKHKPKLIYHYNASGKLVKTSKYKKPRSLDSYRSPGK